jgi:hypothetical protein
MPRYDFKNIETGEIVQVTMSYTKLSDYKEQNPTMEQYHSVENLPVMSDGSRMSVPGMGKPDSAFEKYVIQRMKETIPGNTMGGHKTKTPREW